MTRKTLEFVGMQRVLVLEPDRFGSTSATGKRLAKCVWLRVRPVPHSVYTYPGC